MYVIVTDEIQARESLENVIACLLVQKGISCLAHHLLDC